MANDMAPFGGGALVAGGIASLAKGLAKVRQTTTGRTGGDPILRMGRDGGWIYGQDNVEVQEGSSWAINPASLQHGYVAWVRNGDSSAKAELHGEAMVGFSMDKPVKSELPQRPDAPWEEAFEFQLRCMDGDDAGTEVRFKTSSMGGREAVNKVIDQIIAKIANAAESGDEAVIPVVHLDNSFYQHKKYQKVYTPVFTIVGWMTGNETVAAGPTKVAAPVEEVAKPKRPPVGQVPKTVQPPKPKRAPVTPQQQATADLLRATVAPAAAEPAQAEDPPFEADAPASAPQPVRRRRPPV